MAKEIENIDISNIKDPSFIKKMNYVSLDVLCEQIRQEIIKETSLYGGHLSSNLGVVELTVALHKFFDFPRDKLIFDVGHQCYTHKILTGRSLEHLNEKGQIAGFQRIEESEYDCYDAGHSSTSLSAAQGFAIARDMKGEHYNVVAVIGDASIVNGLSFEALNSIGSGSHKVIIILNDNDMAISQPAGGLGKFFRQISTARFYNKAKSRFKKSLLRTKAGQKFYSFTYSVKSAIKRSLVPVNLFDEMGFTYMGPYDGHNIKALQKVFKKAENTDKSVIIHVHTTKGKGYSYAENDRCGYWHGVTPFDIATGQPKNLHPGEISWSHYFSDLTLEVMGTKTNSCLVVPATLKGSGLEKPFEKFPNRCLDVGIAEEHAATLCGALALNGYHPILSIYSTFLQRAYDEISHDCARMKSNMTILIDRAGLVGCNGETHQGIYDEAFLKSIPNVVVSMPSNRAEAKALYYQSFDNHGVFCIRFPRSFVSSEEDVPMVDMPFGKWRFINRSKSKKIALIAVGPEGLSLFEQTQKENIDLTYVDPVYLWPIDTGSLKLLLEYEHIFIYDPYGTNEGFVGSVLSSLMVLKYSGSVNPLSIPTVFVQHMSVKEQEKEFGLLPSQVIEKITSIK